MTRISQSVLLALLISLSCFSGISCGAATYFVTNLDYFPGGLNESNAYAINSLGQVVGWSTGRVGAATYQHAFLWTPNVPNGTTGSIQDLGGIGGFPGTSFAYGINSYGQVVGDSDSAAFLWTPTTPNGTAGNMNRLPNLPGGSGYSKASAINSMGQVVGSSDSSAGTHAFLWTPNAPNERSGSIVDLGDLGGNFSNATSINKQGQVAGASFTTSAPHGFLWSPTSPNGASGSMIDLGDLPDGDDWSVANGINSYGQVAGQSETTPDDRAFLWNPDQPNGNAGSLTNLGNLPAGPFYDTSSAYGINSYGQVVGYSQVDRPRAVVWNPDALHATTGAMFDLNVLLDPVSGGGWSLAEAHAINDAGQIVGYGFFDPDGSGPILSQSSAFLLTPKAVPEPPMAVLVTGILVLLVACFRFR
jgi:probable HAF family extracellular repeat protein